MFDLIWSSGKGCGKIKMENSFTVGGWGQDWTEFPFVGLRDTWLFMLFCAYICGYEGYEDMEN